MREHEALPLFLFRRLYGPQCDGYLCHPSGVVCKRLISYHDVPLSALNCDRPRGLDTASQHFTGLLIAVLAGREQRNHLRVYPVLCFYQKPTDAVTRTFPHEP